MFEPTTLPVMNNLTITDTRVTQKMDLVVPCCNPPEGWVLQMASDYHQLCQLMPDTVIRLILVNDGSVRNVTPLHLQQLRAHIPDVRIIDHPVNRGKGYAVRLGVAVADAPYLVCTDFDFPFGVEAVKLAYEQLLRGSDIVAGTRGDQYVKLLPPTRKIITRVNRLMNRYLLQLPVADAQAGLKAFNSRGRCEFLSTNINGFLYDSEFVSRAGRNKTLNIRTIPIVCRPDIRFSEFKSTTLVREFFNFMGILIKR
ncbi:glycosyltransferase [Chitinophaga barathri]|uniref:Glycosyltransferase n=1 Tax=Chitinophaga barathri TaxID=1647451 RepID=A0A3N4ME71_9BACT|nr:glycosyltransferase [Chitinophaga barathri]RPD42214.1 glycosyltransferase [Chitinophaga barathri]